MLSIPTKNHFNQHNVACYLLVFATAFWTVFAWLSGSEAYSNDGILIALWKNLPNASIWMVLWIAVFASRRFPVFSGWLTILFSIFTLFFFHTYQNVFTFTLITAPLLFVGILLMRTNKQLKS